MRQGGRYIRQIWKTYNIYILFENKAVSSLRDLYVRDLGLPAFKYLSSPGDVIDRWGIKVSLTENLDSCGTNDTWERERTLVCLKSHFMFDFAGSTMLVRTRAGRNGYVTIFELR